MMFFNKKFTNWYVLTPFIVMVVIFLFLFLFINWMFSTRENLQKKVALSMHEKRVYDKANSKIKEIFKNIESAKDFYPKLDNNEWLIEYFQYSLHVHNTPNEIINIFAIDTKKGKLIALYSTQKDIVVGSYLPEKFYLEKHGLDMHKLINGREVFVEDDHTHNFMLNQEHVHIYEHEEEKHLHEIMRPYPHSNLVVSVGVIAESFENAFLEYLKKYSHESSNKNHIIFFIIFFLSLIFSVFISKIIKQVKEEFEESQIELEKKNKLLKEQLYKDSITGLYNEKMLHKSIEEMDSAKLILIEIDNFTTIGEYSGYEAAEEVINYMKRELLDFCKKYYKYNMKLFRVGNKQFALLENAPLDVERYEELASKLVQKFKGASIINPIDGKKLDFNCTVGFSLEELHLFETASIALRKAKLNERDYLCYFKKLGEDQEYKRHAQSADFIRKALENDKVVPFFQPIFDKHGNVTKHECLVRILGENEEIIAPRIFLETSKRIKRYSEIEKSLIQKSLQSVIGTNKVISINLSSRDMTDSYVSNFVVESINKHNLSKQIIFEILEDENVKSIERVGTFIKRVKEMGVKIAIDDFGSGYSNFSYMLALQPDFLKIDGSLIKSIHESERSRAIVSAILEFAKRLDIKTVAEFIHNKEVLDTCIALGIDEFQGFYLGEPGPNLL